MGHIGPPSGEIIFGPVYGAYLGAVQFSYVPLYPSSSRAKEHSTLSPLRIKEHSWINHYEFSWGQLSDKKVQQDDSRVNHSISCEIILLFYGMG